MEAGSSAAAHVAASAPLSVRLFELGELSKAAACAAYLPPRPHAAHELAARTVEKQREPPALEGRRTWQHGLQHKHVTLVMRVLHDGSADFMQLSDCVQLCEAARLGLDGQGIIC